MYTPTKSWLDITNQGQGTSGIEETNHHHIDTQATGKIHKAIHSYIINIFLGPCPYVQPHQPFTLQRTRRRHLKTFAQARILLTNLGAALGAPSWKQNSRQCPTFFFAALGSIGESLFHVVFAEDIWGQHYISMCNKEDACHWLAEYVRAERLWFQPCCPSQCLRSSHSLLSLLLPVATAGCTPRPSRQCSTELHMSSFCRLYLGNIKTTWKLRKWTPLESPKTNSLPGPQKLVQWVILLCRNLQIMKVTPHPKLIQIHTDIGGSATAPSRLRARI